MAKFHGEISTLKSLMAENGLNGNWSSNSGIEKFITNDGGILQWYESTGTLLCQGKGPSKAKIEQVIKNLNTSDHNPEVVVAVADTNPGLFIVYGHDETSRDQLELVLSKVGIQPFILAKSSGHGMTIIEALEKQVGQNGSAS